MDMSLVISSSVSDILDNFAIFKTSLISLLPVFHTDEAIVLQRFDLIFNYPYRYYFEFLSRDYKYIMHSIGQTRLKISYIHP